jgi:hypothetical protein
MAFPKRPAKICVGDAGAGRGRMQSLESEQDARLLHLFVVFIIASMASGLGMASGAASAYPPGSMSIM